MVPGDRTATQNNTIQALGFDSLTNYQWVHYVTPSVPYEAWGETATASWAKWIKDFSIPFFPHVSVGWDPNPRYKASMSLVTDGTPELFEKYLRQATEFVDTHQLSPPLITVNSWNEWSEGSYLEPDTTFGMGYLEAVRNAVSKKSSR